MPAYFQTPDNAFKRAKEFLEVGKKISALEVLNDFIRSRKHKSKWTLAHEEIMFMFTDLCIDLQRSSYAKDGLYQYRTTCKDTALSSFEKVVKRFLSRAEEKAQTAKKESAEASQAALQAVEDLDYVATPEGLLLSTVSSEGTKERTDRVLLTPWVKFLWESHRNILELLKNNNHLQTVYRDIAKDAFKFCLSYERRTEFRKLCDILRNHLVQAQKYQKQDHSLKFDQPETVQCLVDIRFEQLESSIKMDLWQEAFKAIEEIHNLLGISGKVPKPGLLENFYSKQAKVYLMAGNRLFHAAALHKLFVLRKEQKKTLTPEEAQATASQVLLATLCIPIEPVPSEIDRFLEIDNTSRDKARRLAGLLRIATPPTRASLLRDMVYHNVLQFTPVELQQLHQFLEQEFNPLLLCKRVAPILGGLESDEVLKEYVSPLREITLVRLIKEVSQVYETIELSRLSELAAFANATDLERVVVDTARTNGIQVRIDHQTKSLRFGMDVSFSHKDDTPEGPHVQPMPSEVLCNQLTLMSQALQQAVRIINAKEIHAEQLVVAKKTSTDYQTHQRGDHRQVLQRKQLIEARKEYIENTQKEKEQKEEKERLQKEKQERQAEEERLKREAEEREEEKKRKELEEMKLKRAQDRLEALKKTSVGAKALANVTAEDLADMDADEIFSKQLHQMEKEKKERDGKLKAQEKKIDYFERAKRMVEIPLLEKQYDEQKEKDRELHEEFEEERIASAIKERKEAEKTHTRLLRMKEDQESFRAALQNRRREVLQDKLACFEEKLKKERVERLEQRRKDRKQKRKIEAAEVKKAEEEKLARLRREEEQKMEEMKRKERDAHLEAMRQKQLEREREAEEKQREREQRRMKEMMEEKDKAEQPAPERERERERESERDSWRDKPVQEREREMVREKEREPQKSRYIPPAARAAGGAYRPPGARDERERDREPDLRERDRDFERDRLQDQRWPSSRDRDSYGSPRGPPRGREWDNSPRGGRRGPRDDRDEWRRDRDTWRGGEQEDDRDRDRDRPRHGYDDDRWKSRDEQERDRGRDGGRGWRRDGGREDGGWRGRSEAWRGRSDRDGDRDREPDQDRDRDGWRGGRGDRTRDRDQGDGWRGGRERDQDHDRGRRDWDRDRDQDRDRGDSWRGGRGGDRDLDRDRGRGELDRDRGRGDRDLDRDRGRGDRDLDRDRGRWELDRDRGRGDRDGWRGGGGRDRDGDWTRRGDDRDRPPRDGRGRDVSPRSGRRLDDDGFEVVSRRRN